MHVLIVILNWRTPDLVIEGLASLEGEQGTVDKLRVVVTDNDSQDGSYEKIDRAIQERGWSAWATARALPKNGGYCYGNNGGFKDALASDDPPDFVLLLNPDAYVRPGAIATLANFLVEHPKAGIAGARVEDPDGTVQQGAFRFPSVITELLDGLRLGVAVSLLNDHQILYDPLPEEPAPVDWVVGAAMMVRREVYDAIGLMDEGYFLYFDEVDFCHRAMTAGFERWYVPTARVVHHTGAATGISKPKTKVPRRPKYWFNSRRRYWLKHNGRAQLLLADLAFLAGFGTYRLRAKIQGKEDFDPPKYWRDFLMNSSLVRRPGK